MLSIFKTKKEEVKTNTIQQYLDFIQFQIEQKNYVRQGGNTVGYTNPYLEIKSKNKDYNFLAFFIDERYEKSRNNLVIQCQNGASANVEFNEDQEAQFNKIIQIYKDQETKKNNEYQDMLKANARTFVSQCFTKNLV